MRTKKYHAPNIRHVEIEIIPLLIQSGVYGSIAADDITWGGFDDEGDENPDAKEELTHPKSVWDTWEE